MLAPHDGNFALVRILMIVTVVTLLTNISCDVCSRTARATTEAHYASGLHHVDS